jgi:hypothetical protein
VEDNSVSSSNNVFPQMENYEEEVEVEVEVRSPTERISVVSDRHVNLEPESAPEHEGLTLAELSKQDCTLLSEEVKQLLAMCEQEATDWEGMEDFEGGAGYEAAHWEGGMEDFEGGGGGGDGGEDIVNGGGEGLDGEEGLDNPVDDMERGDEYMDEFGDLWALPEELRDHDRRIYSQDPDILNKLYKQIHQKRNADEDGNVKLTGRARSNIILLKLLKGLPLNLFVKIKKWAQWMLNSCRVDLSKDMDFIQQNRVWAIEEINTLYDYTCSDNLQQQVEGSENISTLQKPMTLSVPLPNSKVIIPLVLYDYLGIQLHWLMHPLFQDTDNLILDLKTPGGKTKGMDSEVYGEVDTGCLYRRAYVELCCDSLGRPLGNCILQPIVRGSDESYTDVKGKFCFWPVIMRNGLFKLKVVMNPSLLQVIALLPNFKSFLPKGVKAVDKLRDYHYLMRIAMRQMAFYQRMPKLKWDFLCLDGDVPTKVELVTRMEKWLGDVKELNMWACRIQDRSSGTTPLCRRCKVPFPKTCDHT